MAYKKQPAPIIVTSDELKPWEVQPGETAMAYEAFCAFRDLKPSKRTVAEVARKIGKRQRHLEDWGRKNRWVERALLYDTHLDRVTRMANQEAIADMNNRHATEAQELQEKTLKELKRRLADPDWSKSIQTKMLLEILVEAVKIERLALGEPSETSRMTVDGEVSHNVKQQQSQEVVNRVVQDPVSRGHLIELHRAKLAATNDG